MPLTTKGIAVQILGSVRTHRTHASICTVNDCKVVINHLVRKFSEPLTKESRHKRMKSVTVSAGDAGDTVEDHAIPVIVIVEHFLQLPDNKLDITEENIDLAISMLCDSLLLVEITRKEDNLISSSGYQRRMPDTWSTPGHPHYQDPTARYQAAGIELTS